MSVQSTTLVSGVMGKSLGYACVKSSALIGLTPHPITVEVSCTKGPPFFQMVGLPEAPVREARVRVQSALCQLGVLIDSYAITVNLAPADLPKSGATLDLALALGILAALERFPAAVLEGLLVLGELSLDGSLRPMRGLLPQLHGTLGEQLHTAIVPEQNAAEAGLVERGRVLLAPSLGAALEHLLGQQPLREPARTRFHPALDGASEVDLASVHGQPDARRAVEVAAAGNHNLLMIGPPGAGKTLLARALRTVLPPLTFEEALETTAVHSVAGVLRADKGIVEVRPFRAPHHSVSEAGLVGGGSHPRPGEVSLAHNGVLFLDELAEFRRGPLEALRGPLEDGHVFIARVQGRASFPARPLLVGAMNPCPCGYARDGHPEQPCQCSPAQLARYRQRLSGPLLDRLDIHVPLPPVDLRTLSGGARNESSALVRARVVAARERQLARWRAKLTSRRTNGELPLPELERVAALTGESKRLLQTAAKQLGLSARAFVKVLRVARTIADLEQEDDVSKEHVTQAILGRILDQRGRREHVAPGALN
jgi:magnesium chelatase family protein